MVVFLKTATEAASMRESEKRKAGAEPQFQKTHRICNRIHERATIWSVIIVIAINQS